MKHILLMATLLFSSSNLITSTLLCKVDSETNYTITSTDNEFKDISKLKLDDLNYFNFLTTILNSQLIKDFNDTLKIQINLRNLFPSYNGQQIVIDGKNVILHSYADLEQSDNLITALLHQEFENFLTKVMLVSMVSDIALYYSENFDSSNSFRNDIITKDLFIIKDLVTEINLEENEGIDGYDNTLVDKNGQFINQIKNWDIEDITQKLINKEQYLELQSYSSINYFWLGFSNGFDFSSKVISFCETVDQNAKPDGPDRTKAVDLSPAFNNDIGVDSSNKVLIDFHFTYKYSTWSLQTPDRPEFFQYYTFFKTSIFDLSF